MSPTPWLTPVSNPPLSRSVLSTQRPPPSLPCQPAKNTVSVSEILPFRQSQQPRLLPSSLKVSNLVVKVRPSPPSRQQHSTTTASNIPLLSWNILEDQRVFDRESAICAPNILNSFFKPSECDVPNTCIPPSNHDPSGPIPKLFEALPASGRTSEDPVATRPTKIKPDSLIITPKDCDLDNLICSLEDLLARLEWEDNEDPVNWMPVTASISLEDRVPGSTPTTHEDRSFFDVEPAITFPDVFEVLSRLFNNFVTPLTIPHRLESLFPIGRVIIPQPTQLVNPLQLPQHAQEHARATSG